MQVSHVSRIAVLVLTLCLFGNLASAEPIRVRYRQGATHGFVALKTLDGKTIAVGEATQTVRGDQVSSRLVLHFRDGSLDDDVTVFTQREFFHLVSDHHIQHGPSFPKPVDFTIDMVKGEVTNRTPEGKVTQEHMELPDDVSNGLPPNLLLNILPTEPESKIAYVVAGAKPRLVHLSIKPTGTLPFTVGGIRHKATDFTIHVELGGVVGVVAPLVGKQPTDSHIWIQGGAPPAFIREEGELYEGGPVWRIEQISPSFAH